MFWRAVSLSLPLALFSPPLLAPAASPPPSVSYGLQWAAGSDALNVRVCVEAPRSSRRFFASMPSAGAFLIDASRDSGKPLRRDGGALIADDWGRGECLDYAVSIARIAQSRRSGVGWQAGDDLLFSSRAALWRPRGLATAPDAEISVSVPPGHALSVPWTPLDRTPHRRFRLGTTPADWPTLIAIGRFPVSELRAGEGQVRVALTGVRDTRQADVLRDYARDTARDNAAVFPGLFARAPQLATIAVGRQDEAVPFGQSFRGGGTAIVLFVDETRPRADYRDAWTLHHEFMHLAHPYLDLDGRWISEGIATYFQNVVRARAGRQGARASWREIESGFARGRADHVDETLEDTSLALGERQRFMRAYWSGTALMLLADVELRQRREPVSLELALNRWLACCAARADAMDVREFLAALDRQVGGETLTRLYRQHARSRAFPDVSRAYDALGIAVSGKDIRYSDDRDAVAMRRAIMGGD